MMKTLILTILVLSVCNYTLADDITITGRVYSVDGSPQGGINVLLKGTSIGTATDMSGYFTLDAPEGKAVLLFAFLRGKAVEHMITLEQGFQYQVNVALSRKTQTFNKSIATTAILPADAAVIRGRIVDHQNSTLEGVLISQGNNGFKTMSDADGYFVLPLTDGKVRITFKRYGSKDLDFELESHRGASYEVDVILVNADVRRQQSRASWVHH